MRVVMAAVLTMVALAASAATLKASRDRGEPLEVSFVDNGERVTLTLDGETPDWGAVEALLDELEPQTRSRWLARLKGLEGIGSDWTLVLSDGEQRLRLPGHEPEVIVEIHERMAAEGARLAEEAERMVARLEREGELELKRFHLQRAKVIERMIRDQPLTAEEVEGIRRALEEQEEN